MTEINSPYSIPQLLLQKLSYKSSLYKPNAFHVDIPYTLSSPQLSQCGSALVSCGSSCIEQKINPSKLIYYLSLLYLLISNTSLLTSTLEIYRSTELARVRRFKWED